MLLSCHTDLHDCSFMSITYSTSSSSSCELSLEDPAAPVRISSRTHPAGKDTSKSAKDTAKCAAKDTAHCAEAELQRTLHTALPAKDTDCAAKDTANCAAKDTANCAAKDGHCKYSL